VPVEFRRVGPGGAQAADNAFGVALVTLWHRVTEAGGAVGFSSRATRSEVAGRAAGVVADLRGGRLLGITALRGRQLVGAAMLRPGVGLLAHTGWVSTVMVDPAAQGAGIGVQLVTRLIDLARERGLEKIDLSVRDGSGADRFYRRFGFVEWGRRPGWVRVEPGDDRDEVFYLLDLTRADPATDGPAGA
jgi:ribosomal protein S18 acetylase RimI-like enzyme